MSSDDRGDKPKDWVIDDTMSGEETLLRFEALNPMPTTGGLNEGKGEAL